ncbi:hypothetical protein JKP88DRAFT_283239 [Tribonema minus]|uniref:Uncharacterized protein n=1 Tax=Tribonema minus TaxID=303371 RepID=A0A835YLP0_9STRA|nr:hypothetical protein JKP88DRAFT_283239 [Tribonema minus]
MLCEAPPLRQKRLSALTYLETETSVGADLSGNVVIHGDGYILGIVCDFTADRGRCLQSAELLPWASKHWRRESAADFVLDPPGRRVEAFEVSGELYRTWALSILNEEKRGCPLHRQRRVLTVYCTTFAEHEDGMYDELLHPACSVQWFVRFSAQQRAVARVAEVIAPMRRRRMPPEWRPRRQRKQKHRKWRTNRRAGRRVVFFGVAAQVAARGRPPIPTKAVVWQLACRTVIIMAPEAFTTVCCPGCGQRTQPGGEQHGHTNRVCNSTLLHRACLIQAAALDGNQGLVVFNCDRSGATNMGMRGVCAVCGVEDIIPGYPWMGPEGNGDK